MSKNALVLSVGGTPDPLIWCINNLKPDFVYFIHSEKTLKDADTVLKEAEFSGEYKFKLVNNHEDLQESFAKSREVIVELKRKNFDISVDFTGGSKPMVAGLVLAAIGENCKYTYVGTSSELGKDKNGVGIVKSGFETIKDQKDPYDTFAVLEIDRAINFFNTYQFEAAKKFYKCFI